MPPRRPAADEEIDFTTDEGAERVEQLISEVMGAEEPIVKIARRMPDHGLEYCGQLTVSPGMNIEEEVAQGFGGGKYVCQFWGKKEGQTRRSPSGSITIRIAGEPRARVRETATPAAPAAVPGGDVYELKLQLAELKGMLAGMQQAGPKQESLDPVSMMEKLSNVLTNAGVRSTPTDPMDQITKVVQAVKEVVGVGREIAPEEGSSVSWAPVIEKATDAITTLVKEAGEQRRLGKNPAVPVAAAQIEAAPVVELPEGTPMWQAEIAQWVPQLVQRAEQGKNAQLAGELLLEELTPGTVRMIQGLVEKDPNFVATVQGQLEGVFPAVKQHAEWFGELLEEIRDQFTPEDAEPSKPEVVH